MEHFPESFGCGTRFSVENTFTNDRLGGYYRTSILPMSKVKPFGLCSQYLSFICQLLIAATSLVRRWGGGVEENRTGHNCSRTLNLSNYLLIL